MNIVHCDTLKVYRGRAYLELVAELERWMSFGPGFLGRLGVDLSDAAIAKGLLLMMGKDKEYRDFSLHEFLIVASYLRRRLAREPDAFEVLDNMSDSDSTLAYINGQLSTILSLNDVYYDITQTPYEAVPATVALAVSRNDKMGSVTAAFNTFYISVSDRIGVTCAHVVMSMIRRSPLLSLLQGADDNSLNQAVMSVDEKDYKATFVTCRQAFKTRMVTEYAASGIVKRKAIGNRIASSYFDDSGTKIEVRAHRVMIVEGTVVNDLTVLYPLRRLSLPLVHENMVGSNLNILIGYGINYSYVENPSKLQIVANGVTKYTSDVVLAATLFYLANALIRGKISTPLVNGIGVMASERLSTASSIYTLYNGILAKNTLAKSYLIQAYRPNFNEFVNVLRTLPWIPHKR